MAKHIGQPRSEEAVLEGLEGVKQRLASNVMRHKVVALSDALNYGQPGLDLVVQVLRNESEPLQWVAYLLLKERAEIEIQQALYEYFRMVLLSSQTRWKDYINVFFSDLRTPLNAALGFLKLILEGMEEDREEELEFIEEAYKSLIYMLNVINDLCYENGHSQIYQKYIYVSPHLTSVNLLKIFDDVEKNIHSTLQWKGLIFRIFSPESLNQIISYGEYNKLCNVFSNIIDNAIKFTANGEITLIAEIIKKKVTFDNIEFPEELEIKIVDTGIGMSPERIISVNSWIYSWTYEDRYNHKYSGRGIGLPVCGKLLEIMGGKISLDSPGEGLGSTVTFTVPCFTVMD